MMAEAGTSFLEHLDERPEVVVPKGSHIVALGGNRPHRPRGKDQKAREVGLSLGSKRVRTQPRGSSQDTTEPSTRPHQGFRRAGSPVYVSGMKYQAY